MDKRSGALPLVVATLLAGSVVSPHLISSRTIDSPTRAAVDKPGVVTATAVDATAHSSAETHDVVDVLGEVLGVDIEDDARLLKLVGERLDLLSGHSADKSDNSPGSPRYEAARFVRCFLDLNFAEQGKEFRHAMKAVADARLGACNSERGRIAVPAQAVLDKTVIAVRSLVDRLRERIAGPTDNRIESRRGTTVSVAVVDAPRNGEPPSKSADADPDEVATRPSAVAARETMELIAVRGTARKYFSEPRFIISTLPDPIQSQAGWLFDPMIEAIGNAAAANGYVLDHFHFPDSDGDGDEHAHGTSKADRLRIHRRQPGIVIFRKDAPAPKGLLVLLVVPEMPTSGIHQTAFRNAMRSVLDWQEYEAVGRLVVLGPTFSGSSQSVARAINEISDERCLSVSIVTGSATSDTNRKTLQIPLPCGHGPARSVTFDATVQPDSMILAAMNQYISGLGRVWPWKPRPFKIAILQESNTAYGNGLKEAIKGLVATRFPFPLHISRVRADPPGQSPQLAVPTVAPRFRPLILGDEATALDQLPAFASQTTIPHVELVLANILQSFRREHFDIVGIMATDARDKLFLARRIARESPRTLLFTTEGDLLYTHPDFYAAMSGMVIASPYPLYDRNQVWADDRASGLEERHQFPSSSVQGVYNAAIALINGTYDVHQSVYKGDGTPDGGPRLVEYRAPGERCSQGCEPPVWISAIGREMTWPLKVFSADALKRLATENSSGPYALAATGGDEEPSSADVTFLPVGIRVAFVLLLLCGAAHAIGLAAVLANRRDARDGEGDGAVAGNLRRNLPNTAKGRWPSFRRWIARFLPPEDLERLHFGVVCLAALALVLGFGMSVALEWIGPVSSPWILGVVCASPLVGVASACLSDPTVRARIATARKDLRASIEHAQFQTWMWLIGGAVFVWAGVNLVFYVQAQTPAAQGHAHGLPSALFGTIAIFVERASSVGNGVSPTVPVVAFGLALYLLGAVELYRLHRPTLLKKPEAMFLESAMTGGFAGLDTGLFKGPILAVPTTALWLIAGFAGAVALFGFDPVYQPILSIDGIYFGRFATSLLMLLHVMIIAALVQFVCLWNSMSAVLRRLAAHPLRAAYGRIPSSLFPRVVFPRLPNLLDLEQPVRHWLKLNNAGDLHHSPAGSTGQSPLEQYEDDVKEASSKRWSEHGVWTALVSEAANVMTNLQKDWKQRSSQRVLVPQLTPFVPSSFPGGLEGTGELYAVTRTESTARDLAISEAEEFVAMPVVFILRALIARMWDNVTFVMGALMLVFCGQTVYRFPAKQQLQAFVWTEILVGVAVVLYVFVKMERDEVLSAIQSTTPGRIHWDRDFVAKLAFYGLIPVIGLFAVEFPDIGGTLLAWLEPMQKALP